MEEKTFPQVQAAIRSSTHFTQFFCLLTAEHIANKWLHVKRLVDFFLFFSILINCSLLVVFHWLLWVLWPWLSSLQQRHKKKFHYHTFVSRKVYMFRHELLPVTKQLKVCIWSHSWNCGAAAQPSTIGLYGTHMISLLRLSNSLMN